MSKTKIEWTNGGETWNPLIGCSKISKGCQHCYAIKTAWIRMHNPAMKEKYAGTVEKTAGGSLNWTGKVNMSHDALQKPLNTKKPTVYFVNSMSDLFHKDVPWNFIYKVFEVMLLTPQHTYQVLTKRAERLHEIADINLHLQRNYPDAVLPLKNVWLGVSVEDQKAADERIPKLLQSPAAVRFLSCEPLLGPVNLTHIDADGAGDEHYCQINALTGRHTDMARPCQDVPCIDWVIVGGESGPDARPMNPAWAKSLRDQCAKAGVPYFFKQWGDWKWSGCNASKKNIGPWEGEKRPTVGMDAGREDGVYVMVKVGKKAAGRLLDGQLHDAYPLSCAPTVKES